MVLPPRLPHHGADADSAVDVDVDSDGDIDADADVDFDLDVDVDGVVPVSVVGNPGISHPPRLAPHTTSMQNAGMHSEPACFVRYQTTPTPQKQHPDQLH